MLKEHVCNLHPFVLTEHVLVSVFFPLTTHVLLPAADKVATSLAVHSPPLHSLLLPHSAYTLLLYWGEALWEPLTPIPQDSPSLSLLTSERFAPNKEETLRCGIASASSLQLSLPPCLMSPPCLDLPKPLPCFLLFSFLLMFIEMKFLYIDVLESPNCQLSILNHL